MDQRLVAALCAICFAGWAQSYYGWSYGAQCWLPLPILAS